MTFGGNIKRAISFYAALAFFAATAFCAMSADQTVRTLSVLWLAFGLISLAGVWANGLRRSTDEDDQEWAKAIK